MEVHVYSTPANQLPHCKDSPAMEVQDSGAAAAADIEAVKEQVQVDFPKDLCETSNVVLDFDSWTSLIAETEKMHADDMERISLVFDSFLSKFPLYPEYWKRYADHMMRLCTVEKVVEIFERAVESATHSVGLWVDYCSFSMLAFKDPDNIRRLFERALSFVGKDYLCHTLWDMYLKFEFSQQQWSALAHIIIRSLKFPTEGLHDYYDNLKKFASIMEEEMACQGSCKFELESGAIPEIELVATEEEICHIVTELQYATNVRLREKALCKYISIGKMFYHKACQLDEKIHHFESYIQTPIFHAKPLDDTQLESWHAYLDFIEKQDDFDWAVKLYERCLIICASYPEFWMRYVEFMESKGGREIANFALDRATQIFLENVPEMHYFTARFKEQVGDIDGARAAFLQCHKNSDSDFIEQAIKEANMEKRLGNLAGASDIHEKALKAAVEGHLFNSVPFLCIHFHRLNYLVTGNADAARDILINGIQYVPHCRSLLEELIKFAMMHEGSRHLDAIDSIIDSAISSGTDVVQSLGAKDREEISCLYLEFVDLCGSSNHLRKAWKRHIKLFPHLIRTPFSYKHPTISSDQLLNIPVDERSKPLSFVDQMCTDHDPDNFIHLSEKEQVQNVSENKVIVSDQVTLDKSPHEKDCGQGSMQHISLQVSQSGKSDSSGSIDLSVSQLHDVEGSKSTPHFEQSDVPITPLEPLERDSDCVITEHEQDQEHGAETHLNTQKNDSREVSPTAIEHAESQEICELGAHPSSVSPLHSAFTVSAKKSENELEEIQPKVASTSDETVMNQGPPPSSGAIIESDEHAQQHQKQLKPQNDSIQEQIEAAHTQTHISQYPMQSNEQLGHTQQTHAYNQMLEYYYQQQQQYQQQLLVMQQAPYSQQHQQPYNQPQFGQHYLQQQQQQQLNVSPFTVQQIQQPQYQIYPNQEQYQQYQMLVHQYQLQQHQLQGYQQMQQYQQLQQQQQEHQQQIYSMQSQRCNLGHGQQGQGDGLLPTPGPSEISHNQHIFPQVVAVAGSIKPVISPAKFRHSPHGGGSSESLLSPKVDG